MNLNEEIERCVECELCADVCPIYEATEKELFAPFSRLNIAKRILEGEEVSEEMIESMYNCLECSRCEEVCPNEIKITEVVEAGRAELVNRGLTPLEGHKRIIKWIMELGNSVGGEPKKRLEWLPEKKFEEKKSDTLLYLGWALG